MDAITKQIQDHVADGGEEARRVALDAIEKLRVDLQTPYDVFQELHVLPLHMVAYKIGSNLNLWQILSKSSKPMSLAELSKATKAPEITLSRILRHLAAMFAIGQPAQDVYAANNKTHILARPGIEGNIYHNFDSLGPILNRLPSFLEESSYAHKTDPTDVCFNALHGPEPAFVWAVKDERRFAAFQAAMTGQMEGVAAWHTVFPMHASAEPFIRTSEAPVFVDVGGGLGHQCLSLLRAHPDLSGRLILEDLEQSISSVPLPPDGGVEGLTHDFFQPQPPAARGARYYYLRTVLHDWPDEQALQILGHLRDAAGDEGEILIDETVLPDAGAHVYATALDLIMMCALGGMERTEGEWRRLLDRAGLEVRSITRYNHPKGESIIQAGKKRT